MRNVIEIGFGVLFLVGALFNSFYTLSHGDEFYGSFAENALLKIASQFVSKVVIPNARFFTAALIAFQLLVALAILSRGELVRLGLLAGGVFAFSAVFVSNMSGGIANLFLALSLIYLASTR